MIVATVLRSGGDFKPEHVILLRDQIAKHTPAAKFVCLSDVEIEGVDTIPLIMGWPGWWSKIELFRPGIFREPVVYFDLDTVILSDISGFERKRLTMLKGPISNGPASGVMAWGYDYSHIFKEFKRNPGIMHFCNTRVNWGDQGFIRMAAQVEIDLFTEGLCSYKMGQFSQGCKIIYFHGKPRPWETDIYKKLGYE